MTSPTTTMKNREVFTRDPVGNRIPNGGVAKIGEPATQGEWDVLRYELSSFVCEGEYERGLETVLNTYLGNLGGGDQPAVWVSGFYGSGKSHLVRVLEFLWRDMEFSDGATARSVAQLPDTVREKLRELDTVGRRGGGLWSAAGTLGAGAGESVRLAILGVIFEGSGLPRRYAQGRFVLWLMQSGFYEGVRAAVEAEGRNFRRELQNLYVSPHIARALLSVYPAFASGETEARSFIKAQYPSPDDVSDEEMLDCVSGVLELQSGSAELPCTLLVLDELQQYIGDNADRTLRVQQVVEACSSRFEGRVLFVATGQSALQATPQLQKLQGRFTVQVSLSDTDVEEVVRKVILRKDETKKADLARVLEENSGEIDRQLSGTRIQPTDEDRGVLVADYPLLPTRRRFWERVLRAIDRAGAAGQLRTQLRIVQEATEEVAELPVGNVIAADFIYDDLSASMIRSGVLLREVDETIRGQRDGTEEGGLRSRLCALILLICQLPRDAGSDSGLRATPETLADLLVQDIREGSAPLHGRIPDLLNGMVESGKLMSVDGEYRLQTREGAEWTAAYQSARARIFGDDARISGDRSRELREAVGRALRSLGFVQGESKVPRKAEFHFGLEPPKSSGTIPVWVRDAWSVGEKQVRAEAQAAGRDDPVVHVFLPKRSADELKKALASFEASSEVVSGRPVPSTQEGKEARASIEGHRQNDRARLDAVLDSILRDARIFLGGGAEVSGDGLRSAVEEAGRSALERLYPRFAEADHARWDAVLKRAREGNADALTRVGYIGDAEKHAVCREVLAFVGPGRKGREVRARFEKAPYGWPQDAVDAAVFVLVGGGHLQASVNGSAATARTLDQKKIGVADLKAETLVVSMPQRLTVRKLLTEAGIDARSDEEPQAARAFVDHMLALARRAGGEPPLPAPPNTSHLRELGDREGNELLLGVFSERDRLRKELAGWETLAEKARERMPEWQRLLSLLGHAREVADAEDPREQAGAIRARRTLLDEPDPVAPLLSDLTGVLRASLNEAHDLYAENFDREMAALGTSDPWRRLTEEQRQRLLTSFGLRRRERPHVESGAAILDALDATSLSEWESLTYSLSERFGRALAEAARLLEPKAVRVRPPGASLATEDEVDEYLAGLRERLLSHIREGRPVIL